MSLLYSNQPFDSDPPWNWEWSKQVDKLSIIKLSSLLMFRCLGWGGALTDEPLSDLLEATRSESIVTHLDR